SGMASDYYSGNRIGVGVFIGAFINQDGWFIVDSGFDDSIYDLCCSDAAMAIVSALWLWRYYRFSFMEATFMVE
ncbi:MAG: hypothetical protein J7527_01590, partial [Chitinophagaceae bacterium]|nr:hypothetical protein [Chitinophagaceae bacterium]